MALVVNQSQRFNYTGKIETIALKAGRYRIQCAGARGGGSGDAGGYAEGIYELKQSGSLQICVGQTPSGQSGGYGYGNGYSGSSGGEKTAYGGGGGSRVLCNSIQLISAAGGKGKDTSYSETKTYTKYENKSGTGYAPRTGWGSAFTVSVGAACTVSVSCRISSSAGSRESFKLRVNGKNLTGFVRSASFSLTFRSAGSQTIQALAGVNGVSFSYSYRAPVLKQQTITHTVNGGSGGGSTSTGSLSSPSTGSNSGAGYVIITCLAITSLIINTINCTVDGIIRKEITTPQIANIAALTSMLLNGIPSILDNISVPGGLAAYTKVVSLQLVQITIDATLLSRGLEYTIEAFYHENERLNSDYYKNARNQSVIDWLKLIDI